MRFATCASLFIDLIISLLTYISVAKTIHQDDPGSEQEGNKCEICMAVRSIIENPKKDDSNKITKMPTV